VSDFFRTRIAD